MAQRTVPGKFVKHQRTEVNVRDDGSVNVTIETEPRVTFEMPEKEFLTMLSTLDDVTTWSDDAEA